MAESLFSTPSASALVQAVSEVDRIYEGLRTDENDGEFALWAEDDLVAALHALRPALAEFESDSRSFVRALDLHKERIRRLQLALCECPHHALFQADLHDEDCPVFVIAAEQAREYEPRV